MDHEDENADDHQEDILSIPSHRDNGDTRPYSKEVSPFISDSARTEFNAVVGFNLSMTWLLKFLRQMLDQYLTLLEITLMM